MLVKTLVIGMGILALAGLGVASHDRSPIQNTGATTATVAIVPDSPTMNARMIKKGQLDDLATSAMKAGNYAEAASYAQRSVALGNAAGLSQELLAKALFEEGNYTESLKAYKLIADQGGTFARNELPYALLLLKAGDWPQAVNAYNIALPQLPRQSLLTEYSDFSPSVYNPKALEAAIYVGLGLQESFGWTTHAHTKTLQEYQAAMNIDPNSPVTNYYYGNGLKETGQADAAKAQYKKTAKMSTGAVKAAAEAELK